MMKLSTRARYSLRAMIELALRGGDGVVHLDQIAASQGVSTKYLEQLAGLLRNAGLVRSQRGPKGGYSLAKPASDITALDIVRAVDGPLDLVDCIQTTSVCDRSNACAARRLWMRVSAALTDVLGAVTLAELRDEQRAADRADAVSYQI